MKRKFSVLMMVIFTLTGILTPGLLPAAQVNAAAPQAIFFVAPNGSDTNPGTEALPFLTLQKARNEVRAKSGNMTGDIIVYLRGGTYTLAEALTLGQSDSGKGDYKVIYQNYPGETPVISGGQKITGWTQQAGNIYKAHVGTSLNTRQLYVNGSRAIRARSVDGSGWEKSDAGFKCPTAVASWGNITDVEVVGRNMWKEFRGGIQSVTPGTPYALATMKQPFWTNANSHIDWPFPIQPDWIENAYELLDSEGEWYLNRTTGDLYYKPRAGENMDTAEVIAPKLERLISGTSVKNVVFKGLTFSYATWLRPNNAEGLADHQGVQTTIGQYASFNDSREHWVQCDGNLEFTYSENLRFEGNKFTHLGGAGLSLNMGCKNNVVFNNTFEDISAHGIIVGYMHGYYADAANLVKNNLIDNNLITKIGQEYHSGMGIIAYYTEHTVITYNELHDLPYTGISCGWGWGGHDPSVAKNNLIQNNLIYDIMKVLKDGGGIYTLSSQPGTTITGNVIHDDHNDFGAIYLDDFSGSMIVQYNAVYNNVSNFICKGSNHDFQYNYYTAAPHADIWWQTNSIVANNTLVANPSQIPSSITSNAGRNVQGVPTPTPTSTPTPTPTPTQGTNLALNANAVATAYYIDGSTATMHPGYEANKAIDGNSGTWAQASGQYAWIEQVDAGGLYNINRVKVTFRNDTFATDYTVLCSPNGTNWTPVAVVSGHTTGGTYEHTFTAAQYRYVRVQAIKPDAAGQLGAQMAITELEVYADAPTPTPGANLALNASASAYYVDGSAAAMHSGCDASKAVDGNTGTRAQAMNRYAWIELVDLGGLYNISRVKVTFPGDAFATEYIIQCSPNGTNWTPVAIVSGHTAGGTYTHTFTAAQYRYVWVQAIKPDAADQLGGQMAISEIEVYN